DTYLGTERVLYFFFGERGSAGNWRCSEIAAAPLRVWATYAARRREPSPGVRPELRRRKSAPRLPRRSSRPRKTLVGLRSQTLGAASTKAAASHPRVGVSGRHPKVEPSPTFSLIGT
uniref:Uncharacterized protein n=1 Tax=Aegilops tauschii subsp. strangulata TaxID=200361 RepID=A0A452XTX1_AEGTS